MSSICQKSQCTMCNACATICPQKCISSERHGNMYYMVVDQAKCVGCHLCEKVCPNLNATQMSNSEKCYVSWTLDEKIRRTSASGGVAAALYSYAISSGMYIAGVRMEENFEAHYKVTNDPKDIVSFQNSKYTFSFTDDTYREIAELLKNGQVAMFIGLPCQVAGLKNYLHVRKVDTSQLYTVDLICHGTPMPEYLQEHIHSIEEKKRFRADKVYFRDPRYGTGNFLFTIYGKQKISIKDRKFSAIKKQASPAYKKLVISDDLYQIGYHNGWIYRDCCYQCYYAQKARVGDLTIADYHGLGKLAPYHGSYKNVSCILVNNKTGQQLIDQLQKDSLIYLEERILQEPYTYDPQLSHPSKGGVEQKRFVQYMAVGDRFTEAAKKAFGKTAFRNHVKEVTGYYWIMTGIKSCIPSGVKNFINKRRWKRK